jgi:two-component system, LuxR family, response regulator FixJ
VVDYNMPGMNGIELVEQLEERHLHHPVILITSGNARNVPEAAVHPNIREVLEKPLEDDALLDRIHSALASTHTGE